jgi:hypothetical protein
MATIRDFPVETQGFNAIDRVEEFLPEERFFRSSGLPSVGTQSEAIYGSFKTSWCGRSPSGIIRLLVAFGTS